MSNVLYRVPPIAVRSIIAQSLAKSLAHIRLAEGVAPNDTELGHKLKELRQMAEDLLRLAGGIDQGD